MQFFRSDSAWCCADQPEAARHCSFTLSVTTLSLNVSLALSVFLIHSPVLSLLLSIFASLRFSRSFSLNASPLSLLTSLCGSLWFSLCFSDHGSLFLSLSIHSKLSSLYLAISYLLSLYRCHHFSLPPFLSRWMFVSFSFEVQWQSVKARLLQKSSSRHTTPYLLDESYSV